MLQLTSGLLLQLIVQVHRWALLICEQETFQGTLQLREGCPSDRVHVPALGQHHLIPVYMREVHGQHWSVLDCMVRERVAVLCNLTTQDCSHLASSTWHHCKWPSWHPYCSDGGRASGLHVGRTAVQRTKYEWADAMAFEPR